MHEIQAFARYAVFAAFAVSVLIATASWLVRTRRVSPFGALGRALRGASDPLIRPVETRLVRRGGNPVHAGWWLVIVVTIAGLVLLWLMDWVVRAFHATSAAFMSGPRALLVFLIVAAFDILSIALLLRVLASWFGFFRYARWMRPAYALTDWLVEPIRRVLPPTGAIDWSPLVAWLALWIIKQLLLNVV
ncbi:MAG TPA: YggT family protein [Gemmatimonadales bacterium]|nr:YggT family protein [Gemmatimonadales bacterium]